MELEFKKFKIKSDDRQYTLQYRKGEKANQYFHYSDFESLIRALPNKVILKSEATKIDELMKDLRDLKYFIERTVKNIDE